MGRVLDDARAAKVDYDALPIQPGQLISERYVAGEVIGGGGMGVVFSGTHALLGTPVAIKLIHSDLKDDAEAVQRFVNEARATAGLKGEHIARVFDVGLLPTGEPYLVMEQLEGIGLDEYVQERGPLAQTEAVDIVLEVCEGLSEAHQAKLVHRDIKPANLFLARRPDGQFSVKILDFGIAKQRIDQDTPALTNPGKSLGSPWYMSPEQMLTPASVDDRADVWSLGVLIFELLTARRPFDGESVPQVCANVLTAAPPLLGELRADLAPAIEQVVMRCLEKEPERRFSSVEQLAQALLPFASAPTHVPGIALEEPELSTARIDSSVQLRKASYGSLTPLHASTPAPPMRRAWPITSGVVALLSLAILGWASYRDPTLLPRSVSAAGSVELPWVPRLLPNLPADLVLPEPEPPVLLQRSQAARAVPELERSLPLASEILTPEQVRARVANYEAWLKAQGLTRLKDAEVTP